MESIFPKPDYLKETKKIISFIQDILKKTGKNRVVIGLSGGIDSAASFLLLKQVLKPEQIFAVHIPYTTSHEDELQPLLQSLPKENYLLISIKDTVDQIYKMSQGESMSDVRKGNIMARVRMIILYDLAKKYDALVCGTENKSEYHLGYFTRFGDEASDFEPIRHLYKTQVYELAKHLTVPDTFLQKAPTAGLWKNQTDEKELGFSYEEADKVLFQYFEKGITFEEIEKSMPKAKAIIDRVKHNDYKHHVPYSL